jgi:hypothetical protein
MLVTKYVGKLWILNYYIFIYTNHYEEDDGGWKSFMSLKSTIFNNSWSRW